MNKLTITWVERGEELSLTMTSRAAAFEMYEDLKADDNVSAAEIDCDGLTLGATAGGRHAQGRQGARQPAGDARRQPEAAVGTGPGPGSRSTGRAVPDRHPRRPRQAGAWRMRLAVATISITEEVSMSKKRNRGRHRKPAPVPWFEVGQRVVCVDATPHPLADGRRPLTAGKIYVVRAIDIDDWREPGWGVHLEGVTISFPGRDWVAWAFHPRRFRPVTERPTDIAELRKLLTRVSADAVEVRDSSAAKGVPTIKPSQQYAPWAKDPDPPDLERLDGDKLEAYFRKKRKKTQRTDAQGPLSAS